MDVKKRLQELMDQRGWSMYRLSKEAGIPWSTVRNVIKRNIDPNISTLEIYCKAFGISLSQFFDDGGEGGLTEDQRRLVDLWSTLDERERRIVMELLEALHRK